MRVKCVGNRASRKFNKDHGSDLHSSSGYIAYTLHTVSLGELVLLEVPYSSTNIRTYFAQCRVGIPFIPRYSHFSIDSRHATRQAIRPSRHEKTDGNDTPSASVHRFGVSVIRNMGVGSTEFLSAQSQQNFNPQFQHDKDAPRKNSLNNLQVRRRFCKWS